jgi:uncharacterized protein YjbI with pentapeptide repeats
MAEKLHQPEEIEINGIKLSDILKKHELWINSTDKQEGERVNLTGASLSRADLSKANLQQAILSRADLSEASLTEAILSRAYLHQAILKGAILTGAILTGADLSYALISEASLSEAILKGAYLTGANLSGANLSGADLSRANLSGANLSRANLSRANLSGANLTEADLTEANLSGANLYDTKIKISNYLSVKSLYKTIGLSKKDKLIILEKKPKLFNHPSIISSANVSIYIADKDVEAYEAEELVNAIGEFMGVMGYIPKPEMKENPVYASFWQRLKFVLKSPKTQEEVEDILQKAKIALEHKLIKQHSAEETLKFAEAIEKLMKISENYENFNVRIESLIFIKNTVNGIPEFIIENLSPIYVKKLEEHPLILKDINTLKQLICEHRAKLSEGNVA